MGSFIHLCVGNLEIDWGKNEYFTNHSALFLAEDVKPAPHLYSVDTEEEDGGAVGEQRAFIRPLGAVVRRLEMLGYTLRDCERRYNEYVALLPSFHAATPPSFEQFFTDVRALDVVSTARVDAAIPRDERKTENDRSDSVTHTADELLSSFASDSGLYMDPYIKLRLLAENPRNLGAELHWTFADIVDGGWAEEDDLYEGLPREDVCLVVTEGSSDGAILRHSLPLVAPDIADFFEFVDMTENYPFAGAGNLYRFCQGLSRIKIQNRILVVLDNDTAGREAYQRIAALDLPPKMRVTVLPDLDDCRAMRTLGPTGTHVEDINKRAVAIECFLDLSAHDGVEPVVRWSSYNAALDTYQGELVNKEAYTRRFLDAVKRREVYDLTKLSALWQHLFSVCTASGA